MSLQIRIAEVLTAIGLDIKSLDLRLANSKLPAGGTIGQMLSKIDATDYNTQWTTPVAGGGGANLPAVMARNSLGF